MTAAAASDVQTWIGTAASVVAVTAAVSVIVRKLHRWGTRLQRVVAVVEERTQELTPGAGAGGYGTSLRDDVAEALARLAEYAETSADQVAALTRELHAHVRPPGSAPCRCEACTRARRHAHVPHPVPRAWAEGV